MYIKKHISRLAGLLLSLFMACETAHASYTNQATDATDTGSLEISLKSRSQIRISRLDDILLTPDANGNAVGFTPACIYRNGFGSYTISAYPADQGNDFLLRNDAANSIEYQVRFDDGSETQELKVGEALGNRRNADRRSVNCVGSGNNAIIHINVNQSAIDAAPAGEYSGILVLVVAPE